MNDSRYNSAVYRLSKPKNAFDFYEEEPEIDFTKETLAEQMVPKEEPMAQITVPNVDFKKETLAEQMPDKSSGLKDAATGSMLAFGNPTVKGVALAMQLLSNARAEKVRQRENEAKFELNKSKARQQALAKAASIGQALRV